MIDTSSLYSLYMTRLLRRRRSFISVQVERKLNEFACLSLSVRQFDDQDKTFNLWLCRLNQIDKGRERLLAIPPYCVHEVHVHVYSEYAYPNREWEQNRAKKLISTADEAN